MKKLVISNLFFLLSIIYVNAQWEKIDAPTAETVYAITHNDSHLFAGTSMGIYVSSDNGTTWELKNNGLQNLQVKKIHIFNNEIFMLTNNGIFFSHDNGDSWLNKNEGLNNKTILSIINDGENIYIGTSDGYVYHSLDKGDTWAEKAKVVNYSGIQSFVIKDNIIFAGTENAGIFVSIDNGETWERRNTGLYNKNVKTLFIKDDLIFAGTYGGGIYISYDNGQTWATKNNGLEQLRVISHSIEGDNIYLGTRYGLFKSENNGQQWNFVTLNYGHINSIVTINKNIFVGLEGVGLYISNDRGKTWKTYGFLDKVFIHSVQYNDNELILGAYNGIYVYNHNQNKWEHINFFQIRATSFSIYNDKILVGTLHNGIFSSSDRGSSWLNFISTEYMNGINYIFNKDNYIYIAMSEYKSSIYRSSDNGETWNYSNIQAKDQIRKNALLDNRLFISSFYELFYSDNDGETWEKSEILLNDIQKKIYSLNANETNIFLGTNSGLLSSSDKGVNWTLIDNQFSNTSVNSLASYGKIIFAGSQNGQIIVSTNNGISWIEKNIDISNSTISYLCIIDDYIYALTYSDDIFRAKFTDLNITNVQEPAFSKQQVQIIPNPAYDYIEINFNSQIPVERQYINIYNLLGEKVLSRELSYSSTQRIDITNLPVGIYNVSIGNVNQMFVKM